MHLYDDSVIKVASYIQLGTVHALIRRITILIFYKHNRWEPAIILMKDIL